MRISLSNHAIQRCKERNIHLEDIKETIFSPDNIEYNRKDYTYCYKKKKDKYIFVVYGKNQWWDLFIITVYKTSKLKKYL